MSDVNPALAAQLLAHFEKMEANRPTVEVAAEVAAFIRAHNDMAQDREALRTRQQELLQTIRKLSAEVPYPEESRNTATLIAEVGTLRARVVEWKREASSAMVRAATAEDAAAGYRDQFAAVAAERDEARSQWDAGVAEMTKASYAQVSLVTSRLHSTEAERDAAITRAEAAERELDEVGKALADVGPTLVIAQQIANKNVTPGVIAGYEMIQAAITALTLSADKSSAENYIEIVVEGVLAPFDRAAVHLIRPGGKTPNEKRLAAEAERDAATREIEIVKAARDNLLGQLDAAIRERDEALADVAAWRTERDWEHSRLINATNEVQRLTGELAAMTARAESAERELAGLRDDDDRRLRDKPTTTEAKLACRLADVETDERERIATDLEYRARLSASRHTALALESAAAAIRSHAHREQSKGD